MEDLEGDRFPAKAYHLHLRLVYFKAYRRHYNRITIKIFD